ncbi:MAG: NAD-dependent epimerase/dehydratase family protein [Candidatus Absconditicoccaceae bacterium]
MTKVLITGIAGLIGSNFSRYLLDKGYEVVGIDNFFGGYIDFVDPRVKLYEIDLYNAMYVDDIFREENFDYVYHFAAYAAEGLSPFIRNFNYTNNVLCSINIINSCIKYNVKKIIFTSSMAVYGVGNPPFTEDQKQTPIDPYGIAKYTVEMDIKQANEQFGLRYTIVRPHNIIGIYQNIWDKYRNVIGIWIRQTIRGEKLSIFGDGTQQRAFSDIHYYMEIFHKLMDEGDLETFNIGADKHYKIIDVANIVKNIGKSKGYETDIIHYEARHEVKDAYSDHTKAKKILNFNDETNIDELIKKMFDWALTQPDRPTKIMDYEIEKNIYSYWKK